MFNRKLSVAVIKGQNWTLAQVTRYKTKLKVMKLSQFSMASLEERQAPKNIENINSPNETELTIGSGSNEPEPIVKLKAWLKQQKIPLNKLKLAFSCPGTITRIITLPLMPTKDLDKLLTEQVDQYFTLNIADYLVDYRILDFFEEEGQKRQRILLAAIPIFQWEQLCSNLEILGLKPTVIDLTADSLARLYGKLDRLKKPSRKLKFTAINLAADSRLMRLYRKLDRLKKPSKKVDNSDAGSLDIAIVDLSAERVEFIILEGGLFFLYSDQEVSFEVLNDMNLSIQTELEEKDYLEVNNLPKGNFRAELEDALTPVLQTLGGFITFFAARHFGKSIDKIFLTGEYSNLPLITEFFEASLEVETQQGFPRNWKPDFGREAKNNQQDWMKYGSLYGLALRED